jgi:hypothetical protein
MKRLFLAVMVGVLVGCGKPTAKEPNNDKQPVSTSNGISSLDKDTIESVYGPIYEIDIKIIGDNGSSLEITNHPLKSFNGIYDSQTGKINNKLWYKNNNNKYIYHYNQAEGGEKSWSLDHRKPDGTKDWFSGGWTRITEAPYPERGKNDWYSIDLALFEVVSDGEIEIVKKFLDDGATINTMLQISDAPIMFITPLDIAIENGYEEITDLLRKHGGKTGVELK